MKFFSLLFLFNFLPIVANGADCSVAIDWATRKGPLDPNDIQHQMRCVDTAPTTSGKPISLCVFMGTAKAGTEKTYGSGLITAIYSEDVGAQAVQGYWYPRRARSSVELEEILVSNNDFTSSIVRKTAKEPSRNSLEKITITYSDKSLVYQKSYRVNAKKNLQLVEEKKFDCNEPEVSLPVSKNPRKPTPISAPTKS